MLNREDIYLMIGDCIKRQSKLSEWESIFIKGLLVKDSKNKDITKRQEEILNDIWEKVT